MENDTQIILKLTKELKDIFYSYCKTKGYAPAKRLRVLIEEDSKK